MVTHNVHLPIVSEAALCWIRSLLYQGIASSVYSGCQQLSRVSGRGLSHHLQHNLLKWRHNGGARDPLHAKKMLLPKNNIQIVVRLILNETNEYAHDTHGVYHITFNSMENYCSYLSTSMNPLWPVSYTSFPVLSPQAEFNIFCHLQQIISSLRNHCIPAKHSEDARCALVCTFRTPMVMHWSINPLCFPVWTERLLHCSLSWPEITQSVITAFL